MTLALYTWATPNGHKPQIMLEELAVPYEIRAVNIFKGEQLTEEFRLINPNRRIPVLVDGSVAGEPPVRVFESGAILLYLAEKFGRFMPSSTRGRYQVIEWVMWQMGGLGPMFGQGQHFWTYATEKHAYPIERYTKEGHRLLEVMDWQLGREEYLAGDYSIADMACFPWVRIHKLANLSIDGFPNVARWYGAVRKRPAVGRGLEILRDHLTGVPNTKEAHDIVFGKSQFRELDRKLAAKGSE
jgi:GST-like protein